jgi:hypothetical protein
MKAAGNWCVPAPVTAARPRRILTAFPFPPGCLDRLAIDRAVAETAAGGQSTGNRAPGKCVVNRPEAPLRGPARVSIDTAGVVR